MQDIDFLPDQYRRKNVRRKSQSWRAIVVVAFAALLAGAAYAQHHRKLDVEKQLVALVPQYDLAVARNEQLALIQSELQTVDASAELFTYLRHPWPRTQLLSCLLTPLPEAVTLEELQIGREAARSTAASQRQVRTNWDAQQDELAKLPPAARDLRLLREQCDKMNTVVHISGVARESAALHRYLGELGQCRLFAEAELDSIENVSDEQGAILKFDATVIVRPGYGQPRGPLGEEDGAAAPPQQAEATASPQHVAIQETPIR